MAQDALLQRSEGDTAGPSALHVVQRGLRELHLFDDFVLELHGYWEDRCDREYIPYSQTFPPLLHTQRVPSTCVRELEEHLPENGKERPCDFHRPVSPFHLPQEHRDFLIPKYSYRIDISLAFCIGNTGQDVLE
jgi:hypothetical protein